MHIFVPSLVVLGALGVSGDSHPCLAGVTVLFLGLMQLEHL